VADKFLPLTVCLPVINFILNIVFCFKYMGYYHIFSSAVVFILLIITFTIFRRIMDRISYQLIMKMAVFCVVAPYSLVEVYRRFGGACCLHHQNKMSVNFYQTTRRNNPEDSHLHTRRLQNLKSQLIKNHFLFPPVFRLKQFAVSLPVHIPSYFLLSLFRVEFG
jgi:hypothetical protein